MIARFLARTAFSIFPAIWILFFCSTSTAQAPTVAIADVRFGFQSAVKPLAWIPVVVDIQAKGGPFQGRVEFSTPDGDGVWTSIFFDAYAEMDKTETVFGFLRLGQADAEVLVRLIDKDGRRAAERTFAMADPSLRIRQVGVGSEMIVYYGSPGGLYELGADPSLDPSRQEFVRVLLGRELPVQWFAYEGVQTLLIATSDVKLLDQIDPTRGAAIQSWVRQGGNLVVSVAANAQVVAAGFLGKMLPGKLAGQGRVRAPDQLENFAKTKARLDPGGQGLPIATLADVRGQVLVRDEGADLVVTGAYGLGRVTVLAFDTDAEPFQSWEGKRDFWIELFGLQRVAASDPNVAIPAGRLGFSGRTDLASQLHAHLEDFPDVAVVPFRWVALLILGYILLIGPVDYFFLKRVVGRLELTWITFPAMVVVVSVAAYYAAYWLKGDQLRVNRLEIVDVDDASKTLRGTSYCSIFSPRIASYSIAETPGLGADGAWAELGMGRETSDRWTSWLGLPESEAFRGVGGSRGGLLGRRGYFYFPFAQGLSGVPIQVWSVKSFQNRWLAKAGSLVTADLKTAEVFVTGTIINELDVPLADVHLFHGDYLQRLGDVGPKGTLLVTADRPLPIKSNLVSLSPQDRLRALTTRPSQQPVADLVVPLLFAAKVPSEAQALPSRYLRDMDLSHQLGLGRAILLARVPAAGGKLWLNQAPDPAGEPPEIPGVVRTETYLRVLLEPRRKSP